MAFLSVVLLAISFSKVFGDDLEPVGGALPENEPYNCSSITPTGAPTPEQLATARTNCIATGWCLWITAGKQCVLDPCLKWLADGATADCPSQVDGVECQAYYQTDQHNCGTYANPGNGAVVGSPHDLYCRVRASFTGYDRSIIDTCFYGDLKARASSGTATCGSRPCAWTGTSATESPGRYCTASDADVCTDYYGDWNKFCGCIGAEQSGKYCNLHPKCMYTGGQCIEDACTRATGSSAGSACNGIPNDADPNECISRYEQHLSETGTLLPASAYCANKAKNNNSNNCFYALTTVVRTWETTDHETHPDCTDSQTYDHCTEAYDYDYSSGNGGGTRGEACQVAEIPSGWFPGTQICINSGRAVPSVSGSASFVQVSSLVVLLIIAAFGLTM